MECDNRGRGRPESTPKKEDRAPQNERGRGQKESREGQSLPNVWDVLEREVSLEAERLSGRTTSGEYDRETRELNQLREEIDKKGVSRDNLILDLYRMFPL